MFHNHGICRNPDSHDQEGLSIIDSCICLGPDRSGVYLLQGVHEPLPGDVLSSVFNNIVHFSVKTMWNPTVLQEPLTVKELDVGII